MNQWCVVILSYNHHELTTRCVQSVLKHKIEVPVYLIHNGSRPQSAQILKNNFPSGVIHVEYSDNRGYSGGANRGLQAGFENHDWILFITNDCELLTLGKVPTRPGMYAPLVLNKRTQKVDSVGGALNFKGMKLRHLKDPQDWKTKDQVYIPGSAFWMHKSIWAGGEKFLESLSSYWEDVELSVRLTRKGYFLSHTSDTVFLHGIGKTCRKDKHYTLYLYQRNKRVLTRLLGADNLTNRFLMFCESLILMYRLVKQLRFKDLILFRQSLKDSSEYFKQSNSNVD